VDAVTSPHSRVLVPELSMAWMPLWSVCCRLPLSLTFFRSALNVIISLWFVLFPAVLFLVVKTVKTRNQPYGSRQRAGAGGVTAACSEGRCDLQCAASQGQAALGSSLIPGENDKSIFIAGLLVAG